MIIAPSSREIQCERNIRALLTHHDIPVGPLLERQEDRLFFGPGESRSTADRMRKLDGYGLFSRSPESLLKGHGETAVCGWRELAAPSLQVIFHDGGRIELDIDLANPRNDVWGAIIHAIEVLWPGKTDPERVRRGLEKRGILVEKVSEA